MEEKFSSWLVSKEGKLEATGRNYSRAINRLSEIMYEISGFFFALLSLYFFNHLEWYWITIIAISSFVVGFLLLIVIFVFIEPDHFKSMAVMDQVEQYPANEKWIAFSKDSFNLLLIKTSELQRRSNHDNIMRIARKKGVGILVVSRMREEIFLSPSFNNGEFLECYCVADKIRQHIS